MNANANRRINVRFSEHVSLALAAPCKINPIVCPAPRHYSRRFMRERNSQGGESNFTAGGIYWRLTLTRQAGTQPSVDWWNLFECLPDESRKNYSVSIFSISRHAGRLLRFSCNFTVSSPRVQNLSGRASGAKSGGTRQSVTIDKGTLHPRGIAKKETREPHKNRQRGNNWSLLKCFLALCATWATYTWGNTTTLKRVVFCDPQFNFVFAFHVDKQ